MLKALPTDEECKLTGCPDAGIFMMRLKAGTLPESYTDSLTTEGFADEHAAFINDHAANWGETSMHELHDAMRHMLNWIIRLIEEDSAGADNLTLTMSELKNWAKTHLPKSMVTGT